MEAAERLGWIVAIATLSTGCPDDVPTTTDGATTSESSATENPTMPGTSGASMISESMSATGPTTTDPPTSSTTSEPDSSTTIINFTETTPPPDTTTTTSTTGDSSSSSGSSSTGEFECNVSGSTGGATDTGTSSGGATATDSTSGSGSTATFGSSSTTSTTTCADDPCAAHELCVGGGTDFECIALVGFENYDAEVDILDPDDYSAISEVAISGGQSLGGFNGADRDPVSGDVYVIYNDDFAFTRRLGTFDLASTSVTDIGLINDIGAAAIWFTDDGTAYVLIGDGGSSPNSVYEIDLSDASLSFYDSLGSGDDGETMAWNPVNNRAYHWSGLGAPIFESYNVTTMVTSNIGIFAGDPSEVLAATWYQDACAFVVHDLGSDFWNFAVDGTATFVSTSFSGSYKGLAFVPN